MCDYREGQLILSHHDSDPHGGRLVEMIQSEHAPGVRVNDELRRRQDKLGVRSTLPFRVYLLEVPEGEEHWHANHLHRSYAELASAGPPLPPTHGLAIVPNSYLTLEGFAPSVDHSAYKSMLGPSHGATGKGVTVAVIDSGIEPASGVSVTKVTDIITPGSTGDDRVGHGTAIAKVIHDVAPGATLHVVKVTDAARLVEFDALAGLDSAAHADIINLSMSFGNADQKCHVCGRQSISSRSIVFNIVLSHAAEMPHEPIIVAAAGNQHVSQLRYPARLRYVMAVGAVDAAGNRTSYSNYRAVDSAGNAHQNLFFAPGGEPARPVGSTTAPLPHTSQYGTSLATAFASGVVAWARETRGPARATILSDLRAAASRLPHHSATDDGNGMIKGC
jgi:subtilisin family serine protease